MKSSFLLIILTVFSISCSAQSLADSMYTLNFKRNLLDFNIIDWGYKNISITYRHYFKNGKLGFSVPFVYRPGEPTFTKPEQKFEVFNYFNFVHRFRTGLELDYYPTGQGRLKYYCGPSLQAGIISYYSAYPGVLSYIPSSSDRFFYLLGFNNGLTVQHLKHLNIVLKAQCGMLKIDKVETLRFVAFIGFHVGYRFNFAKA